MCSQLQKEYKVTLAQLSGGVDCDKCKNNKKNMACIICNKESKYKCPTCLKPYCSVNCYKEHKRTPCARLPDPRMDKDGPRKETMAYEYPTDDTVPLEKLKLLEHSTEVKFCLENPHVRKILELLDKSPHPDEMIQEYMHETIFTEFVDACLSVVQPAGEQ